MQFLAILHNKRNNYRTKILLSYTGINSSVYIPESFKRQTILNASPLQEINAAFSFKGQILFLVLFKRKVIRGSWLGFILIVYFKGRVYTLGI